VLPSSEHEMRAAYRTAAGSVQHRADDDGLIALCPNDGIASLSFVETPLRVVRSPGTGPARSYE
jgi:hypothetical protein